jgi:hypothetical protein
MASARDILVTISTPYLAHISLPMDYLSTLCRIFLVFFILCIASLVPNFSYMVSLVGGVCNSLMGFILPPLILMQIDPSLSAVSRILHCLIICFGLFLMYSTFAYDVR